MTTMSHEARERAEAALRRLLGVSEGPGRKPPVIDEAFLARARAENAKNARRLDPPKKPKPPARRSR